MEMLAGTDSHPLIRALWQPRLIQAIDWVAREVAEGLKAGRKPLLAEKWGRLHIADVNLSGKADRIDVLPDGSLAIARKSVVSGKSVSVRVDLGGRRIIKKKKTRKRRNEIRIIEKKIEHK